MKVEDEDTAAISQSGCAASLATSDVETSGAKSLFERMLCAEPADVHERVGYWRAYAKVLAAESGGLQEIADLARELVSPKGMANRGVDRGLVVIEKADKSDPHYRLCAALERYDARLREAGS